MSERTRGDQRLSVLGARLHGCLVVLTGLYWAMVLSDLTGTAAWLRDQVVGNGVYAVALVVLAVKALRDHEQRSWLVPLAAGVATYLFATIYYFAMFATVGIGYPSMADVGYLATYPLFALALIALISRLRTSRAAVRLDAAMGASAGAGAVVLAMDPYMEGLWSWDVTALTSLAYPLGDALLAGAAVAGLGVAGLRGSPLFRSLLLGLLLFAAADAVYLHQALAGTYVEGGWLDAVWATAILIITSAAWLQNPPSGVPPSSEYSLAVVGLSSATAILVLVAASVTHHSPLSMALAALALLAGAARVHLAFARARQAGVLQRQALTDELTATANRRALYLRLDDWLADRQPVGLVLVDLDRFKEVNDTFGHNAGDALLKAVARRFEAALTDLGAPHLLARLGGDEFAMVLRDDPSSGHRLDGVDVMERLRAALVAPVPVGDTALHVQASMGFARSPEHATRRSELLFCADAAMYAAKTSGDAWGVYTPKTAGDRHERLRLAEDLHRALEGDELFTVYQPIVTQDGAVVGAEALVRWRHPERGLLLPAAFLETAERHRLTGALTARVLDLALADTARWQAAGHRLGIAVNVSSADLRDDGLVDLVAQAALRHGVPASSVTVEVAESALMKDRQRARGVLMALRSLGVQIAIDGYGTGYAGLQYLLELDVQELKIDRFFVAGVADDPRKHKIVASTLQLADALGGRPAAGGVESREVLTALAELGCPLMQGWACGRPVEGRSFAATYLDPPPGGPSPLLPARPVGAPWSHDKERSHGSRGAGL